MIAQTVLNLRQLEYLGREQCVMPISAYLSNGFPNLYFALIGINTKCSDLLDNLELYGTASPNAINQSISNLTNSYDLCLQRAASMVRNELCSISSPLGQETVSVEYYVFSSEAMPERTDKISTIPSNVSAFQQEVSKTKKFLETLQKIANTSRWPKYQDITILKQVDTVEYDVLRKSTCVNVERVGKAFLLLVGIFFIQLYVRSRFFSVIK